MVIFLIGIIKCLDSRYRFLHEELEDISIYSDSFDDLKDVSVLVLPLAGTDSFLFIKDTTLSMLDFINSKNLRMVVCGKKNDALEDFCRKENLKLISYLDDEEYVWQNSKLTAEGLLKNILNDQDDSILNKRILIMGYGYSGKAIHKYLKNICNDITIYASDYHDKKELYCSGIKQTSLDSLDYDIIINTINFKMINDAKLIRPETKIYDIASYPYGFCDEILALPNVKILPKIPGIYTPMEAGKIIAEFIRRKSTDI